MKFKFFTRFPMAVVSGLLLVPGLANTARAQQNVHQQSTSYEWPADEKVKAKLDKWQDQKFGIIIHWGLYAVPAGSWNGTAVPGMGEVGLALGA